MLYVNPHGTGGSCNKVDPCGVGTAFTNAATGDNVLIEPGTYQLGTSSLSLSAAGVHVTGVPNAAIPVVVSQATVGISITNGSTLTGIRLDDVGSGIGLAVSAGGSADHVAVSAKGSSACEVLGTLTDALCVTTAANSSAVFGSEGGHVVSAVLRGVTAVATQSTSQAVTYDALGAETLSASLTNVIADGGAASIYAAAGSNSTTTVTVTHSDFANTVSSGSDGTAEIHTGAGNISGTPKFVNAKAGNFQEAAGSPTIDAGAADPKTDLTDLAGRPRLIGQRVDIGAYEYSFAPTLHTFVVKPATKTVKLSVAVNPNGRATKAYFVVRGGKKPIRSAKLSAGAGAARVTLSTRIKGLTPKTKYTVYATATNSAGRQTTKTIKFTTT
jgi:hypothetical protein